MRHRDGWLVGGLTGLVLAADPREGELVVTWRSVAHQQAVCCHLVHTVRLQTAVALRDGCC